MKYLKGFVLGLAIVVGVQFVSAAWTDPSATPPGNNTDTPLNVALSQQDKLGSLFLNTDTSNPYAIGLGVFGKSVFNGTVQIADGTQHAGYVLTSDGDGNASWQPPQGSNTTVNNTNNSGPHIFAQPVKIKDYSEAGFGRGVFGPWYTFDLSQYVPATSTVIILGVACPNASDANTAYPSGINARDSSSSPSVTVCSGVSGEFNTDGWSMYPSSQINFTIDSQSFQWQYENDISLSLVGYY